MTDQPTTPSGSRWEPDPDHAPTAEPPPAPEEPHAQLRSRAGLAGAATALALVGGLTGFVIGHSTAGGHADDLRPANFSGPGGNGQLGEGQQVPPSFGGRDGDGDHLGHGPDLDGDGYGAPGGSGTPGSSGSTGGSGGPGGSGTSANPT
jgi:hypothetical protein